MTGEAGEAARINIGTVTTANPDEAASVTNSGTPNDVILDFVIPRGETGQSGDSTSEVLSAVDGAPQPSGTNQPISFNNNALISGQYISHNVNSPDIEITKNGIYQVSFNATVGISTGTTIPSDILLSLTVNGSVTQGGSARHNFTASAEFATVSFNFPISVTSTPTVLNVLTDKTGFILSNVTITVFRLGDQN